MQDYAKVTTRQEVVALVREISEHEGPIGFDIETGYAGDEPIDGGSTDPNRGYIVGFSVSLREGHARYVPLRHDVGQNVENPDSTWRVFASVLQNTDVVAHNAAFEIRFCQRAGCDLNIVADTMLEAYALGRFEEQGLKPLTKEILGHEMTPIKTLFTRLTANATKTMRFNDLDTDDDAVIQYACEDADYCLRLHHRFQRMLAEDEQCQTINALEHDVLPVVVAMEDDGVGVDFDLLRRWESEADDFIEEMRQDVLNDLASLAGMTRFEMLKAAQDLTDEDVARMVYPLGTRRKARWPKDVNLNSSPQLRKILFDVVGLDTFVRTQSGDLSTSSHALNKIAKSVPEVQSLLTYREVVKLKGSYLQKWPKDFDTGTGRVHPSWKQNGVPAGRFAVGSPGLQQCPKNFYFETRNGRTFEGNFRWAITPAEGHYFLVYDYSQIELRVIAGLAKEPKLKTAFEEGKDPHRLTASLMLNKSEDEIQDHERSKFGKTMNFALLYLMGINSLAERLAVPKNRAKLLYRRFFQGYEHLGDWIEQQQSFAEREEYVRTFFGRRVPIFEFEYARRKEREANKGGPNADEARGKARGLYGHGTRLSVNAPVQGTAADIAKLAMVRASEALKNEGLWRNGVYLVINAHDELVFEVSNDIDPGRLIEVLRPAVEIDLTGQGFPPLETDWEHGTSWGAIQEVK